MSERYPIVSSDCHAGLPCEQYRPYLDPAYLDPFDDFLAEREANRDQALALNYDYINDWETTNEEGLRGAFDSPTPEDLGQDPGLRSDPAEVAAAQWWKAELAAPQLSMET